MLAVVLPVVFAAVLPDPLGLFAAVRFAPSRDVGALLAVAAVLPDALGLSAAVRFAASFDAAVPLLAVAVVFVFAPILLPVAGIPVVGTGPAVVGAASAPDGRPSVALRFAVFAPAGRLSLVLLVRG